MIDINSKEEYTNGCQLEEGRNRMDTKSRIFNASLQLFAINGYENVSVRAIADEVGIKAASIYNHFNNKEHMLAGCYNFYVKHRHISRLTSDQYLPIIKEGTREEVLGILNYIFPDDIIDNMIYAWLIILSRIYTDEKAKEIYLDEINFSMQYLADFFGAGIKIGRFLNFNIPTISFVLISVRIFASQFFAVQPKDKSVRIKVDMEMFDELIKIIPFIY